MPTNVLLLLLRKVTWAGERLLVFPAARWPGTLCSRVSEGLQPSAPAARQGTARRHHACQAAVQCLVGVCFGRRGVAWRVLSVADLTLLLLSVSALPAAGRPKDTPVPPSGQNMGPAPSVRVP